MSKKTLLNEATVRRFMKLADMGTLSDNFINEAGLYQADEDEAMEEGHGMMDDAYQDDEPEEMDMGEEEPMADEAPEMPGDEGPEEMPEPEMGDMEADADEVEISEDDRDVLGKAAAILQKIAGGDMDMGAMDMDDEAGMRDMMEGEKEEEPMEEGSHDKEEKPIEEMGHAGKRDEKELDEVELVDENDLVQEVTRRVAARLRAAMKSRK